MISYRVPRPFCDLVQRDPLFAAEGLDLENATAVLDEMEEAANALSDVFTYGLLTRRLFLTRYPIATHAMPIPFLRRFIKSEQARRSFLSHPTVGAGSLLLEEWRRTQVALVRCIARYRKLHEILFALEKSSSLSFEDNFGNTFTQGDVRATLELVARNAEHVGAIVEYRAALLLGDSAGKESEDVTVRAHTQPALVRERSSGEGPPELSPLRALEEKRIHAQFMVLERHGPLGYTLPHFDGVPTDHRFYLYFLQNRSTGKVGLRMSLADEYYFLDLRGSAGPASGPIGKTIYEPCIRAGIPWWWQPATYFYTMRDQRYWADIVTIIDRKRRPQLDPLLLQSQKSSLLDFLLSTQAADMRWYHTIMKARVRAKDYSYSALYGLLMRSNPSICYLPFNRSVWRLSENPNFLGSGRSAHPMLQPSHAVLPGLDPQTLEQVMNAGRIRTEAWKREEEEEARRMK